jgi:DNA helicase-2/ATP-dependent DNA helicase PcrA
MSFWTKGLNPEQAKAVEHSFGPLLILAGAGSGKTTVLVSRTGRLISEKVATPQEICVLTFTNKAARELKHRVSTKLGSQGKGLWAGTFHSFGLQILRRFHKQAGLSPYFGIVDQSDCNSIIKDLLKDVKNSTKEKFDVDRLLTMINDRRTGTAFKVEGEDEYHEMVEWLTPKFNKRLEVLGVVDFEGLLIKPLRLFKEHPDVLEKVQNSFSQVMVDEFQDTNRLQMNLIHEIVKSHHNISVVGDDDQSIYGWRGAEVKNILNFPKEFKGCEVIKLERNYRSSSEILAVANATIAKNKNRHGKVLRSEAASQTGTLPELFILDREEDECDFVVSEIQHFMRNEGRAYKDFAILYRSNTQGGLIESSLRRANIPYNISGGTSIFDRREIKDIMAYFKQALAPNEVSLRRIINVPSRGIGDATIEKLTEYSQAQKLSFLDACRLWKDAGIADRTGESITQLLQFLQNFPQQVLDFRVGSSPGAKLVDVMQELGYKQYVYDTAADPMSAEKKWIVVEILGRILDAYLGKRAYDLDSLKSFVDAMLLRDDVSGEEENPNKVQLMTLHASKGLEFPVVILAGLEEDLLPNKNLGSDIDEERRLFYVGVTRAKQRLVMSRCMQRKKNGVVRPVTPSRFLLEIPKELYKEFPLGARPVSGQERDDLVSSFLAKLETQAPVKNKSEPQR